MKMGTMRLVAGAATAAIADVCTRFWQNDWTSVNNNNILMCVARGYRQAFRRKDTVCEYVVPELKLCFSYRMDCFIRFHWGFVCAVRTCLYVCESVFVPRNVFGPDLMWAQRKPVHAINHISITPYQKKSYQSKHHLWHTYIHAGAQKMRLI